MRTDSTNAGESPEPEGTCQRDPHPLARDVTSAQVSDSLDVLGVRAQVLDAGISNRTGSARVAGRARTLVFAPETRAVEAAYADANPYADFIAFMASARRDDVIVIATHGDTRTAYWGELFSAAALGRGVAGVVCDSFMRDSAKVRALGFPVFCRGTRPLDFRARMRIIATDVAVSVGGVLVSPGDLVVADDDGVVSIPQECENEVVELANARDATEQSVLEQLVGGASLGDVWERYRTL